MTKHGTHAGCFTFYVFSPCVCQYVRAMTGNTHAASMTTQADDHGHASEFPERLSSCNAMTTRRVGVCATAGVRAMAQSSGSVRVDDHATDTMTGTAHILECNAMTNGTHANAAQCRAF